MRFVYCLFFFLTACSVYGPQQQPWNYQNQGSHGNGYPPYQGYPPNSADSNNPANPNDPNNPANPNDPNNQNSQNNWNPGGQNNILNPSDQGGAPINPFPSAQGISRTNDLPYDIIPDTITSLTCEQTVSFDQSRPYVFTLGSYRSTFGGLRLSKDFIKNNRIEKNTPHQKIRQILEASPLKRAMAQLSIRSEHNINSIWQVENKNILNYFPPFYNADSLNKLSQQQVSFTTRSASGGNVYNSGRFQVFLPIRGASFINLASSFEENTIGDALIAFLYSLGNSNPIASPDRRAYGRSYKLSFGDSHKADYLTGVFEENLLTSKREGKWTCPVRFLVHKSFKKDQSFFDKYRDRYTGSIPDNLPKEGNCYTGGTPQLSALEKRFLEEEFGSSQANRLPFWLGTTILAERQTNIPCIVPKTRSCYPTQGFYRIEFNPQKACSDRIYRVAGRYGEDPMEEDFYNVCPAYLSACFRIGD